MQTLKILMIGHSLGNDATNMTPMVFKHHSDIHVVMGVLYHSGCRLAQHVDYLEQNAAQYAYYEFDTELDTQWRRADCKGDYHIYTGGANDIYIADGTIAQTMAYAIRRQEWDIVVMQAGVFEAAGAKDSAYTVDMPRHIHRIQEYVLENLTNREKQPIFAWNMTWSTPMDPELLNESYTKNLEKLHGGDSRNMYENIARNLRDVVEPAYPFRWVMPSGTAMENAKQFFTDKDLYRDTIHASEFTRLMTSYIWFCRITGTDLCSLRIMDVPAESRQAPGRKTGQPLVLTEQQKQLLKFCAQKAMENPYAVTKA